MLTIKDKIYIKKLMLEDMNNDLLLHFNRHQVVTKVWRTKNGKKFIKDISFVEQWSKEKKIKVVANELTNTIINNGTVFGAFYNNRLIAFASIDSKFLGEKSEYIQLLLLQVSKEYRNRGIGKKLFYICADEAEKMGAKKLYISGHSSIETQAFYKSVSCVDAKWIYQNQVQLEPYDYQLEYNLSIIQSKQNNN